MIGPDRLAFMASLGFSRMEPRDVVSTLKSLGYGGVEWTLAQFSPRSTSRDQRRELVEITRDGGLEPTEVVVQQDLVSLDDKARQDRIDLVQECIEAAAHAGIGILNVFSGPAPWDANAPELGSDITEGQAWDQVIEAYTKLARLAESAEVHLAVEPVLGMLVRDYYTLHQLLTAVDSPYLSVNFDPSHLVLYRNDSVWAVRQLGKKIVHCHLKDAVGMPPPPMDSFLFPLLGEGNVPWGPLFDALNEIGYDGYLSVEFESFKYYQTVLAGDPASAAKLSMEQCTALLELQTPQ